MVTMPYVSMEVMPYVSVNSSHGFSIPDAHLPFLQTKFLTSGSVERKKVLSESVICKFLNCKFFKLNISFLTIHS